MAREYLNINGVEIPLPLSAFPIGAIYTSLVDKSPASFIGGTWERIEGKFILAASSEYPSGGTGGASTHSHDAGNLGATVTISGDSILVLTEKKTGLGYNPTVKMNVSSRSDYGNATDYLTPVMGTTANANNMPPYLAAYMWKRVA